MAEQYVFPSFRYRDAAAAIAWLVDVLGFEVRQLHEAADGSVAHAELSHRPGLIMRDPEGNVWSFGTYRPSG
jgi:uncharacterized glyoxalase superfamily protein PhnB